jgi:hypothetical protein
MIGHTNIYSILVPKFRFNKKLYFCSMSRNNEKNIKAHNDKLHKAQDKAKAKKVERAEKLKAILKKAREANSK